jgi:undecaprenyl-diphosphatase
MTLFQALILGIVQGATEFVPISSSGHLVLVPWLLGWPDPDFAFYVLVQLGTLIAVILYFWRDLAALTLAFVRGLIDRRPLATPEARLAWLIIIATIPAAAIGILFKDYFEATFSGHVAAAGFAQAISILPGISRSGATIAGGLVRDLEREAAARFSFLLSIPALLGAGLIALADLARSGGASSALPNIVVGFAAAAIVGYLTIAGLLAYLRRRPLTVFAVYCWLFGGLCLLIALSGLRA